ncbi:MAG TPA: tripartite tricarboxylate transporter substrate binding protein [Burkholderiales bacterium]|nr:tripartite tricarboxylate transporter substrate binding protein [Burkholderiales bacterium]
MTRSTSVKPVLALASWCALSAMSAFAADKPAGDYPNRPLRILVGQEPGGGVDLIARALAQKLGETLGVHAVVDNRGGAAGSIAAAVAAKAAPDGYTALVASATYSINPSLYRNQPFDPRKDIQAITIIGSSPFILLANPGAVPAKNTKELIALARAKPGQLNYASGGLGSTGHLSAVLFSDLAGINLTHIPYKGTGPAMVDLLSGQVHLLFNSMIQGMQYARSGKLTAIGLTSAKRSSAMPELPTIAESGLPGYDFSTWYAFLIQSGAPASVVAKLHAETAKALSQPDFKGQLAKSGIDAGGGLPAQSTAYVSSEITKWAKVVKSSGMKVE